MSRLESPEGHRPKFSSFTMRTFGTVVPPSFNNVFFTGSKQKQRPNNCALSVVNGKKVPQNLETPTKKSFSQRRGHNTNAKNDIANRLQYHSGNFMFLAPSGV